MRDDSSSLPIAPMHFLRRGHPPRSRGLGHSVVDDHLLDIILERLALARLTTPVEDLVIAACEGDDAVRAVLGGSRPERPELRSAHLPTEPQEPLGAYLTSLTVEGFRGIGPATTVDFVPGPGLTVVAGRNGSGKSSLAEAFEILLTGENQRWAGRRTKVWQEGWRNLHHPDPVRIEAELAVAGVSGKTRINRSWAVGADLHAHQSWAQLAGGSRQALSTLGWTDLLTTLRPFLSYNELGSMLENGPSALFDTLSLVLGLDQLTVAEGLLSKARLDLEKANKAVTISAKALQARLEEIHGDERAHRAKMALASKPWDLVALGVLVSASADVDQSGEIDTLRRLTVLEGPDPAAVSGAVAELRRCAERVAAVAGTDAGRARDLSRLLAVALDHHRAHGSGSETCPVCRTPDVLGPAWTTQTEAYVERLTAEAAEADAAHRALHAARRVARRLLTSVPSVLEEASAVGVDATGLSTAWSTFSSGPAGSADEWDDEASPSISRTLLRLWSRGRSPSAGGPPRRWTDETTSGARS